MWKKFLIGLLVIAGFAGLGWFWVSRGLQQVVAPDLPDVSEQKETPRFSLTEPDSLWVIVNKHYSLSEKYVPADLSTPRVKLRLNANEEQMKLAKPAHKDLVAMFNAAKKAGVTLVLGSGYRSGETQREVYTRAVAQDGQASADRLSARPGHSEHQTGLALDLSSADNTCFLETCWATTKEGKWVAANAHKFGFIVRYPRKKTSITGYLYEPWHVRYVGRELSQKIHNAKTTLEEYFELEPAPDYK